MKTKLILLSSCILLLVSACSVNKRAHRPGYNVEWHSANPKAVKHPKLEKQDIEQPQTTELDTNESNEETQNKTGIAAISSNQENIIMAEVKSQSNLFKYSIPDEEVNFINEYERNSEGFKPKTIREESERPDILASLGFWLSLSGLIGSLLFMVIAASQALLLLMIVPLVPLVAGIIISQKSLRLMRENPFAFQKRRLAVAGVWIGYIGLFIWLLSSAVVFLEIYLAF